MRSWIFITFCFNFVWFWALSPSQEKNTITSNLLWGPNKECTETDSSLWADNDQNGPTMHVELTNLNKTHQFHVCTKMLKQHDRDKTRCLLDAGMWRRAKHRNRLYFCNLYSSLYSINSHNHIKTDANNHAAFWEAQVLRNFSHNIGEADLLVSSNKNQLFLSLTRLSRHKC